MERSAGEVELLIPRREEFLRVARMVASAVAAQLEFTRDRLDDVKLAVGEACTNAVEHVTKARRDDILVRFEVSAERLVVEVWDWGQGFDPEAAEEAAGDGETGRLRLGLPIIRAVADEVAITCDPERGGCVRMIWYRKGS